MLNGNSLIKPEEKKGITQSWAPRASFSPYVRPEYNPAATPAVQNNLQGEIIVSENVYHFQFRNHQTNKRKILRIEFLKLHSRNNVAALETTTSDNNFTHGCNRKILNKMFFSRLYFKQLSIKIQFARNNAYTAMAAFATPATAI